MLSTIFWVGVGILVGWNFPQPAYAKAIQQKVVDWFKKVE